MIIKKPNISDSVSASLLAIGKAMLSAYENAPTGISKPDFIILSGCDHDADGEPVQAVYNTISNQVEIEFSNLKKSASQYDTIQDCLLEGDQRTATFYPSPSEKKFAIAHSIIYGFNVPCIIRGVQVVAVVREKCEPLKLTADEINATFAARVVTRGETKGQQQPALPAMPHEYSTEHVVRFASKIRVGGAYELQLATTAYRPLVIKG